MIEGDTQKVVQFFPAATEAIRLPQYKLKPDIRLKSERDVSRNSACQVIGRWMVQSFLDAI